VQNCANKRLHNYCGNCILTERKRNKKQKNERRIAMGIPEVKKETRTWAIVGTVLAILLCGCPGLTLCLFGVVFATGKVADTNYNFGNSGYIPGWIGFALLCVAVIFIAIAVVVPILLLRKKKVAPEAAVTIDVFPPQPPLPPLPPQEPPQPPMPPQDPLPPTS
jgi:hypothetical protein